MIGARGEAVVRVGAEEHPILFTNRALANAERATGKTVLQLLNAGQANALGMGDVAQLLAIGMEQARRDVRSGGRSYTIDDAYRILDAVGFLAVLAIVLEALAAVLSYSGEAESSNPPD